MCSVRLYDDTRVNIIVSLRSAITIWERILTIEVQRSMKRFQPTIRLRPRDRSNSGLDIHTDLEKRNSFSYLNNFPRLKNIVLVGTAFIVLMVGLSYIVDPATTKEWSNAAGQYLPFNTTQFGSAAKASILHYSHLVSDALQGTNETTTAEPVPVVKAPLPPLATGYSTGLVTHSTGFDFVWQPPTERSERTGGGGIVFIAHACKRQPFEWFPASPDCPTCDPMPVQANIVRVLRKNGFSVMAMNPVENPARCWHQNDRTQVGLAMQYVREATVGFYSDSTDAKVSMYAIGVENGGVFLGKDSLSVFRPILLIVVNQFRHLLLLFFRPQLYFYIITHAYLTVLRTLQATTRSRWASPTAPSCLPCC